MVHDSLTSFPVTNPASQSQSCFAYPFISHSMGIFATMWMINTDARMTGILCQVAFPSIMPLSSNAKGTMVVFPAPVGAWHFVVGLRNFETTRSVTNLSYLRYKDKETWEGCFMPLPCHFAKNKFGFPDHCQANFSKFCQAPAELDLQYWTCSVPAQKAKSAGWGAPGFKTNPNDGSSSDSLWNLNQVDSTPGCPGHVSVGTSRAWKANYEELTCSAVKVLQMGGRRWKQI